MLNLKLRKNIRLLVTADGGAASGKTTGAKLISQKYGLNFLSSGLLYRYVGYKLLSKKNIKNKNTYIKSITKNITPNILKNKKLFSPKVTQYAAVIAQSKNIRNLLKKYQRNFSKQKLVCIEGRDIGNVICPDADIKFFFKCSSKVAAKRRYKEFKKVNKNITLNEVEKSIRIRNRIDSTRKFSPLRISRGAVIVDTTKLNKKQMFRKVSRVVEKRLLLKYGRNYKRR